MNSLLKKLLGLRRLEFGEMIRQKLQVNALRSFHLFIDRQTKLIDG